MGVLAIRGSRRFISGASVEPRLESPPFSPRGRRCPGGGDAGGARPGRATTGSWFRPPHPAFGHLLPRGEKERSASTGGEPACHLKRVGSSARRESGQDWAGSPTHRDARRKRGRRHPEARRAAPMVPAFRAKSSRIREISPPNPAIMGSDGSPRSLTTRPDRKNGPGPWGGRRRGAHAPTARDREVGPQDPAAGRRPEPPRNHFENDERSQLASDANARLDSRLRRIRGNTPRANEANLRARRRRPAGALAWEGPAGGDHRRGLKTRPVRSLG